MLLYIYLVIIFIHKQTGGELESSKDPLGQLQLLPTITLY